MTRPARKRPGARLAAVLALCGAACGPAEAPRPDPPPSIVLISVDTLRADHLGAYGYPRRTSPNFDAFAAEGLLFESCLSHAPMTLSSFAALMSGFLPHETRVHERLPLPERVDTLAERLRRVGYSTLAVVSNYVLRGRERLPGGHGWHQGFDVYDDEMTGRELVRDFPERTATHTTDRALELLRLAREPVFLWVHYQDPHGPYAPPRRFAEAVSPPPREEKTLPANDTESGVGGIPAHHQLGHNRNLHHYIWKYDGEIRYFDHELGRLLSALKERGLYDEAFLLFTADHGEGMGEHDLYFSHVGRLHHTLNHVPLVLRHGDRWVGRRRDYVQHLDVLPTLIAVAGLEPDPRLRGRDLREPPVPGREIFATAIESPIEKDGERASLVVDGLKVVRNMATGETRLYDLLRDPGEERDLSADPAHAGHLERLTARLLEIRESDALGIRGVEPESYSPEEIEKLRALGYVH